MRVELGPRRPTFSPGAAANGLVLTAVAFVTLFPFLYILAVSLSDPAAVTLREVVLWPVRPTLETYERALGDPRIWTGFRNSILYASLKVTLSVSLTMMAAYPLSHRKFRYRGFFMRMIVFTMLFQGGLIPLYLVVRNLGLIDTIWAIVLPTAIFAFHLILAKSFVQQLPWELCEAALIDGANEMSIFARVIVPLSKPIIATLTLYYAVEIWNSYFYPLLFLIDAKKFPLQVYLRELVLGAELAELRLVQEGASMDALLLRPLPSPEALKAAILVISTVPILILYPFLQRYFVKGITLGGVKG